MLQRDNFKNKLWSFSYNSLEKFKAIKKIGQRMTDNGHRMIRKAQLPILLR